MILRAAEYDNRINVALNTCMESYRQFRIMKDFVKIVINSVILQGIKILNK
jgi:hypothetical protein